MHLRSGDRGLRVALQKLPGHVSGDAHPDAQGAANSVRSHTVYDVSSGLWRLGAVPEFTCPMRFHKR
jgi:hypothetical protein